jgi:DNA-directed RNA polymerase II subunit RPB1
MEKRVLTDDEIHDILDSIPLIDTIPFEIAVNMLNNQKEKLKKQLTLVSIYPALIGVFKDKIISNYERSLIQPGEMVGILASQSIGRNLTQLTLDSFHSSGSITKTVVTGVPRFTELLSATEKPKSISATIYFKEPKPTSIEEARSIAGNSLIYVVFKDLIKDFDVNDTKDNPIWYSFVPLLLNSTILDYNYRVIFYLDANKIYNYNLSLKEVSIILRQLYSDMQVIWSPTSLLEIHCFVNIKITKDSIDPVYFLKSCLVPNILNSPISGIEGIKNIFFTHKNNEWIIETEGSSLRKIFGLDWVDIYRTTSNSIWEIKQIFGIEATRLVLIQEFLSVISSDGTYIHSRHVELLVDAMTHLGKITSISRYGLSIDESGPIAKATFEESLSNFLTASTFGYKEDVKGVSASITCAKIPKIGTGKCDLLYDYSKYKDEEIIEI